LYYDIAKKEKKKKEKKEENVSICTSGMR